jgi:hypothetical protein
MQFLNRGKWLLSFRENNSISSFPLSRIECLVSSTQQIY